MTENIYERIHRILSWKRILAFNLILFMVLVIPLSVRLAQEDTENRSSASNDTPEVIEPPAAYPSEAPKIDRVSEFFGKKGDTIVILGANFGEYKWGSHVYVGNVEAGTESIIRWSNTILEVQIPESARTGKVWVDINGSQASWEGSLLLTDVARSAQIGLKKINTGEARLSLANASGVSRGMIELGHVGEPINPSMIEGGSITSLSPSADSLGKKLKIEFNLGTSLTSNSSEVMQINHPGIGALEIVRAELYDSGNNLISVYADPLNVKVQ